MATTPIYGFVTPDLAGTADGPAAMSALALRVEREMTVLRAAQEFTQEPNASYPTGSTDVVIHTVSASTSVIGWMEVSAYANLGMAGASGSDVTAQAFAGQLKIFVDGVQYRSLRFHSLWGTRTLPVYVNAHVARSAAQTSANIQLRLTTESGSTAVSVNHSAIYVAQFGAPATG